MRDRLQRELRKERGETGACVSTCAAAAVQEKEERGSASEHKHETKSKTCGEEAVELNS